MYEIYVEEHNKAKLKELKKLMKNHPDIKYRVATSAFIKQMEGEVVKTLQIRIYSDAGLNLVYPAIKRLGLVDDLVIEF